MGIDYHHAALIIREHKHKPLPETVHLVGRQTIRLTYKEVLNLCHEAGVTPVPVEVEIDTKTRNAQGVPNQYMTDTTFFKMLGVKNILAIDHSDYEGAEIILNLNHEIPKEYHQISDFVFGGSVCDNVFDPAMYLRNVANLVKPGGRLVDQNIITNSYHPYAILPAIWYYDYFVINKYTDCKVYIIECSQPMNFYALEVDPTKDITWNFNPVDLANAVGIFLVAERGPNSTTHINPSQDQYRSAEEWAVYRRNLHAIQNSQRPYFELFMPPQDQLQYGTPSGAHCYRFLGRLSRDVGENFTPPKKSFAKESFLAPLRKSYKRVRSGLRTLWSIGM